MEPQGPVAPPKDITNLIAFTQGGPVADFKLSSPSAAPSAAPPPPPPPPPPPVPPPPTAHLSPAGPAAVFAEINKGADVTKGLKKVDPSQMTHKNPSLRGDVVGLSGSGSCTSTIKRFD
jgi:adenylyl cyclase-associated protein